MDSHANEPYYKYLLIDAERLNYWWSHYDEAQQLLNVPGGGVLNKTDLYILRDVLRGHSRKVTAEACHLSIKAVEKRLERARDKLSPNCSKYSLQVCVHTKDLSNFLRHVPL